MAHLLIVDDEEKMRNLLSMMLERKGFSTDKAGDGNQALEKLYANTYDMVISDIKMPEMDGRELIARMKEENILTPVIFITAFATIDSAVEMMRNGGADYITKPFSEEQILTAVERTLKLSRLISENQEMKEALKKADNDHDIILRSRKMKEALDLAETVASVNTPVLITGESGTGKELIARYIHRKSHRNGCRFVPVNCAAISPNLVESELFGYEKGAFTGASERRKGKFEFATGGTLFLDEIGDFPLESQGKLLRALQERQFHRVGGNREIPVDVRVLCATNRNLETMVNQGKFRQDLFFRINVFPIELSPLRQRKEDIVPLTIHFLKKFAHERDYEITQDAVQKLMEYPWPGNVRELANVIERGVILTRKTGRMTSDTFSFLKVAQPASQTFRIVKLPPQGVSLQQVQESLVKQALEVAGNNQTSAAKLLGMSRAKFRVFLKNLEEKSDDGPDERPAE
ncbi:MAG: sigma-54 dependent transcriptional regulator [Desulfobacterales bacterium]|nr:sigma-54 dependent transcriptional regulator [Desulfobacterales bacterium]MDD4073046.1 sigma-54 dependent transcriptional regulator [Desulfobacterales bacterium]MDD4393514.1 sigma-54 dependent transcriptional regulator [Desulfobacterales bacterium]